MIDAIDVESRPLKARPATLRSTSAGLSGAGRAASTGSAGCWRWRCGPSSATVDASPAPNRWCATAAWTSPSTRPICDRAGGYLSRQGPPTLRWALFEAAKNASHQRSPDHDYYTDGEGPSRRQAGRRSRWPASSPGAATTCCAASIPTSSTRRRLITFVEVDGRHRPPSTSRVVYRGQLPPPACPPASVLDGLQTLTRPRSHHLGDTQSRMLSPTTDVRRAPRKRRAPPRRRQPGP